MSLENSKLLCKMSVVCFDTILNIQTVKSVNVEFASRTIMDELENTGFDMISHILGEAVSKIYGNYTVDGEIEIDETFTNATLIDVVVDENKEARCMVVTN